MQPMGIESASTAVAAQAKAMVESRYVMAMRNPRNMDQVRSDLIKECRRPSFADNKSTYYVKPIGQGVEGLGIRFVEVALRCMKNVLVETTMIFEDEIKEVHRVSVTDLEANITYPLDVRVSKTVERSKPNDDGTYLSVRTNSRQKPVYTVLGTDDDILNKRGALISKAIRTIGLRIIPGDLQDEAEQIIKQVRLDKAAQDPDAERRRIVDAFADLGVNATDLTSYLGHPIAQCAPAQLVHLRGIYGAIKDGEATWQTVMQNKAEAAGGEGGPKGVRPLQLQGLEQPLCTVQALQHRQASLKGDGSRFVGSGQQTANQRSLGNDLGIPARIRGARSELSDFVQQRQVDLFGLAGDLQVVQHGEQVCRLAGVDQRSDGAVNAPVAVVEEVLCQEDVAHPIEHVRVQQQRAQHTRFGLRRPRPRHVGVVMLVHARSLVFSMTRFMPRSLQR